MKFGIAALAFTLVATSALAGPRLPPSAQLADDVLGGRVDLERFDFAKAGYWKLSADERMTWRAPLDQKLFTPQVSSDSCDLVDRRRFKAVMWLQVLMQAKDEFAWRSTYRALRRALELHDKDVKVAGDRIEPANDPLVTELARRVARDQIIRDNAADARWTAELPPEARGSWFALKVGRMMEVDCDDTEWLAARLREIGWFDIPTYGKEADGNAWLLVQHADRSPEFQRETLKLLQSLGPGKTNQKNIAFLEDRIAVAQGRPQRYGTQFKCAADGAISPHEIDDPEGVDARRATVGLPPVAEYARLVEGTCPKMIAPTPPSPPPVG